MNVVVVRVLLLKGRRFSCFLGHHADLLQKVLAEFTLDIVPEDRVVASAATHARLQYPINLGERFAHAPAKTRSLPLLTLDSDFNKTDIQLVTIGAYARTGFG